MKKKLANLSAAIRNNRTLKFLAIAAMVCLVVFVGASMMKPKPVVIVNQSQSSASAKHRVRQHRSHSRPATQADASVSNPTNPCATPELRSRETTGTSPVSSLPAQRQNEETRNAPMGLVDGQPHQYRPRPDPIVPNATNNRLPAVVWVSAVAPSSGSRLQSKVFLSHQANPPISLAVQSKSDSGFRTFRNQVEIGTQTSGSGFRPFHP